MTIATYTERPTTVQAIQLTPETADELCRWAHGYRLGPDRWMPQEGCWRVSAQFWWPPFIPAHRSARELATWLHAHGVLVVGIRTRDGERVVFELDWVVQASGNGGGFQIVSADRFDDRYSAVQP